MCHFEVWLPRYLLRKDASRGLEALSDADDAPVPKRTDGTFGGLRASDGVEKPYSADKEPLPEDNT